MKPKMRFDVVVARGKALPEHRRLMFVESPTPTTTRWKFQDGTMCLGINEAEAHIATAEAEELSRGW